MADEEKHLMSAVEYLRKHQENAEVYHSKLEEVVNYFNIKNTEPLKGLVNIQDISLDDENSVDKQCNFRSAFIE